MSQSVVDEDSWKENVQTLLDLSELILLLADNTAGVAWEIEEISRRRMLPRTAIIMLPLSVDASAGFRWRSVQRVLVEAVGGLPNYRNDGAFVFFSSTRGAYGELPFSSLFDGGLVRRLQATWASLSESVPTAPSRDE